MAGCLARENMGHTWSNRLVTGTVGLCLIGVTACGGAQPSGASTTTTQVSQGTVRIALLPGAGYAADVAVVTRVLQTKLGYQVDQKPMAAADSWQALEGGTADVVLENWGNDALKKAYIEQKQTAVSLGPNGNQGITGWYVPTWMAEQYPDITDWHNLNKYVDLFKTVFSGNQGQILDSDSTAPTNDLVLAASLGLNYSVTYSGSLDESVKAALAAAKARTPLLFYFTEPHWLFQEQKFTKVTLPPRAAGCDTNPAKITCGYPTTDLDKIASKKFADGAGKAYEFLTNFKWTNADQNEVADAMVNQHLSADHAAKRWMDTHIATWQAWVPA